jgi:hypothetical protein
MIGCAMENGWYWVTLKTSGSYEVILYEDGLWYRAGIGQESTDRDHTFAEIGPRILSPVDHHRLTAGEIAQHNKTYTEWFIKRQQEIES